MLVVSCDIDGSCYSLFLLACMPFNGMILGVIREIMMSDLDFNRQRKISNPPYCLIEENEIFAFRIKFENFRKFFLDPAGSDKFK